MPLNKRFNYPISAGAGTVVYVLDTGIDINHTELIGRAQWGGTFITGQEATDGDEAGHGTMVAASMAGRTVGVAKNATVIAVKILDSQGLGTTASTLRALSWVWNEVDSYKAPQGQTIIK